MIVNANGVWDCREHLRHGLRDLFSRHSRVDLDRFGLAVPGGGHRQMEQHLVAAPLSLFIHVCGMGQARQHGKRQRVLQREDSIG